MGQRPPHVRPPAHLSKSPPLPDPSPVGPEVGSGRQEDDPHPESPGAPDPTRYGDWVIKGIAIDF